MVSVKDPRHAGVGLAMRPMRWASVVLSMAVGCGDDTATGQAGDESDSTGSDPASTTGTDGHSTTDGATSGLDDTSTTAEPVPMPGDGPFGGGSRLQPIVERGDGAARLLRWYDKELGIECEFARDASGDLRCLPARAPGVRVEYTDEGCNEGLLQVQSCGDTPSFVSADAVGSAACDDGRAR